MSSKCLWWVFGVYYTRDVITLVEITYISLIKIGHDLIKKLSKYFMKENCNITVFATKKNIYSLNINNGANSLITSDDSLNNYNKTYNISTT